MAAESKIEWTDSTFNPWLGCTKVARSGGAPSACDFCYAEGWSKRTGQVRWGNHPRRRTTAAYWRNPIAWNAGASEFRCKHGRRRRVFCASLADVFDNQVDPIWRTDLFDLIRTCDQLDWQLLTKRPQNIRKMLPDDWGAGYPNVWLGTTAEDARAYRQRATHLFRIPAAVHFISYEPAMGELGCLEIDGSAPDWVIIGGESGVRADKIRLMKPAWARQVILECRRVGAAPFLKQWGTYANNPWVVERGLSIAEAARRDPAENGKGGGMLDDEFCREFPVLQGYLTAAA
jgi:protein gp37